MRKNIYPLLILASLVSLCVLSCAPPEKSEEKAVQNEKTDTAKLAVEKPETTHKPKTGDNVMTIALAEGVDIELVLLKGGTFSMGSPPDEEGRIANEGPTREVELSDFRIGTYEVTQKQYEALMGKNPSQVRGGDRPVDLVSWDDAMEFCRKLSEKTGSSVTLPTEAQWEYACRAGSDTRFCFSNDEDQLGEYAWYEFNSRGITHGVGEKSPNAWGVYDMHGNVMEWCRDSYSAYKPTTTPLKNPLNQEKSSYRVVRGGSWGLGADACRSAFRSLNTNEYQDRDIGFRVAMLVAP